MLKRGFSLMEMMIVMLIVAVVAAASAPMISKKMLQDQSNESPWVWTSTDNSIAYNLQGKNNMTAVLGTVKKPTDLDTRLYIESNGTQISLGKKSDSNPLKLRATGSSIQLSDIKEEDATGGDSVAIGYGAIAKSTGGSTAIGKDAQATGPNTTSLGNEANSKYIGGIAIGYKAYSSGHSSIAIGSADPNTPNPQGTAVDKDKTIVIGGASKASGSNSVSIGHESNSTSNSAVAVGANSESAGYSVALGRYSKASGSYAVAIGGSDGGNGISQASNTGAIAIGYSADATKEYSTAVGTHSEATGSYSSAYGYDAEAGGSYSSAYGYGANAYSDNSVAVGRSTQANKNGVAIGYDAKATGSESAIALGYSTQATGNGAVAIGSSSTSSGGVAISGKAGGSGSVAISTTNTPGTSAIGIGGSSNASGSYSVAIGPSANAAAIYSVALGHGANVNNTSYSKSTSLGYNASCNKTNQMTLGSRTDKPEVYVPGNLVVDGTITFKNLTVDGDLTVNKTATVKGNTYLGKSSSSSVYIGIAQKNGKKWAMSKVVKEDTGTEGYRSMRVANEEGDQSSDRRLKNVGEAFKGGLAELKKLPLFHYTYKNDPDKTPHVGVMAQDLQKIFPKAVFKGEDGFLRIRMEEMFYALINAVKELDARIDVLVQRQKKIDELEKEVSLLKKQNAEILKRLEKLERAK